MPVLAEKRYNGRLKRTKIDAPVVDEKIGLTQIK